MLLASGYNESTGGCFDATDNPIEICSCNDLANINTVVDTTGAQTDFIQTQRIDFVFCQDVLDQDYLSGEGFLPIGNSSNPFLGEYDGLGNKIMNLYINRPLVDEIGIFGYVGSNTHPHTSKLYGVENLVIVSPIIIGGDAVGVLIGDISNDIIVSNIAISSANVQGDHTIGGVIGRSGNGNNNIFDVTFSGVISATGNSVGGIVGYLIGGELSDSSFIGQVTGLNNTGGAVGYSQWGSVTGVTTDVSLQGYENVGGIVGQLRAGSGDSGTLNNTIFRGVVNGSTSVGGLIGYRWGGDNTQIVGYSTSLGYVYGSSDVSGILGRRGSGLTPISLSWTNYTDDDAIDCGPGFEFNPGNCAVISP